MGRTSSNFYCIASTLCLFFSVISSCSPSVKFNQSEKQKSFSLPKKSERLSSKNIELSNFIGNILLFKDRNDNPSDFYYFRSDGFSISPLFLKNDRNHRNDCITKFNISQYDIKNIDGVNIFYNPYFLTHFKSFRDTRDFIDKNIGTGHAFIANEDNSQIFRFSVSSFTKSGDAEISNTIVDNFENISPERLKILDKTATKVEIIDKSNLGDIFKVCDEDDIRGYQGKSYNDIARDGDLQNIKSSYYIFRNLHHTINVNVSDKIGKYVDFSNINGRYFYHENLPHLSINILFDDNTTTGLKEVWKIVETNPSVLKRKVVLFDKNCLLFEKDFQFGNDGYSFKDFGLGANVLEQPKSKDWGSEVHIGLVKWDDKNYSIYSKSDITKVTFDEHLKRFTSSTKNKKDIEDIEESKFSLISPIIFVETNNIPKRHCKLDDVEGWISDFNSVNRFDLHKRSVERMIELVGSKPIK